MKRLFLILMLSGFSVSALTPARLNVATTTPDLAALVREVGGEGVDVFAIGKGTQDPHQIEAKPSFMVKLRSADLVLAQGLELESAWLGPLVQGARNPNLKVYELAADLEPLEVVKGAVSRADGDVHPGGNPHFQLDPVRLGQAAVLIAKRLGEHNQAQKETFIKQAEAFQKRMDEKTKEWQERIKKSGMKEIVTYHKTFAYFCDRFQLKCDVQMEPKPGIPPTAAHILSVIEQMKKRKIKTVLIENLYDDSVGTKIKDDIADVKVHRVPVAVEGEPDITTNEKLIERLVKAVEEGAK